MDIISFIMISRISWYEVQVIIIFRLFITLIESHFNHEGKKHLPLPFEVIFRWDLPCMRFPGIGGFNILLKNYRTNPLVPNAEIR